MRIWIFALGVFFISLTYSMVSYTDIYQICNGCSTYQMRQQAEQSAEAAYAAGDMALGENETYHIINLDDNTIKSFEVAVLPWSYNQPGPTQPWPESTLIATPQSALNHSSQLFQELRTLKAEVEELVIPETVVSDAWEFVECAYCRAHVQQHIRDNAGVETAVYTVESVLMTLGIQKAPMPNTYTIPLESGGEILVKMTIQQDVEFSVDVLRATDVDGNDVPFERSQLGGLGVHLGHMGRPAIINGYINPIGYGVPHNTGRVIITECTPPDFEC